MSDPPTMYSFFRPELTVLRPLTPMATAVTPNAMSTTAATSPPISNSLRILPTPFDSVLSQECPGGPSLRHQAARGIVLRGTRAERCGFPASQREDDDPSRRTATAAPPTTA